LTGLTRFTRLGKSWEIFDGINGIFLNLGNGGGRQTKLPDCQIGAGNGADGATELRGRGKKPLPAADGDPGKK
jgi:hypothetical protein